MRSLVLLLYAWALAGCAPWPGVHSGADHATIRVLVLNFDPIMPDSGKPLHVSMGWHDPRGLAEQYRTEMRSVSYGYVRYHIVEWRDLAVFPRKVDGYVYTPESFRKCWTQRDTCHQPDSVDYEWLIREYDVARRIDSGDIDEVWVFGAPFFGYWEAAMAGPGAFDINGGVYERVPVEKRFAIMGFSYERTVAEMMHNQCHRTEATLAREYGGWKADELSSNWARFAANAHQSNGIAAVGSCHYPPNGEKDYDYSNARIAQSNADEWLKYPDVGTQLQPVSRDTWGGPLYHLNFMRWWFRHLPHAAGTGPDGKLNNWWRYVFEL